VAGVASSKSKQTLRSAPAADQCIRDRHPCRWSGRRAGGARRIIYV